MSTTTVGGQDKEVIERWLLDANAYKSEIDEVVKKLKDTQKVERDLELVRQQMSKTTSAHVEIEKKLAEAAKGSAAELGGVGSAVNLLTGVMAGGFAAATGAAIGLLEKLGGQLVEAKEKAHEWFIETEKDVVLYGKYKDQIEGVRAASKNLIDEETVEQNVRRLAFAERKLNQQELDALTLASFELAKRQGVGAKEAMDELTEAYSRGATRGLKELGISLEGQNTLQERQNWLATNFLAIAQSVNVEIDTPLKERTARKNELLALEKEHNEALYKHEGLAQAIHGLEAMQFEMDKQWLNFKFSALQSILGVMSSIASMDAAVNRAIGSYLRSENPTEADFQGDAQLAARGEMSRSRPNMKLPGMDISGRVPGKGGGRGGRQHGGYSPADAYNGPTDDMLAFGSVPKLGLEGAMPETEQYDVWTQAAAQIQAMMGPQEKLTQLFEDQRRAVRGVGEQMMEYQETIKKVSDTIQDLGVGAMSAFGASIWSAADAAIQGQQAFDKAMLMALKSAMYRVATEATAMMFMSLARYALSWGADAGALTAAGMYAAAAGVAGGIGLGLSAATAGSSSPEASSASRTGSSGTYRPSYGTSQERQQQKWVIKVVAGSDDPLLNQALSSAKFRAIAVDDEAN